MGKLFLQMIDRKPEPVSIQRKDKIYTLIALNLGAFLTAFMGSSVTIAVPSIGRTMHQGIENSSWVVTCFIIASVAFLLPAGAVAERYGRKKVFIWGMVFFTILSFACIFAENIWMLIFLRTLQGVSATCLYSTSLAILTAVFNKGKRGQVIGLNTSSVYIGLTIGPLLGGFLTHRVGWQGIFWFTTLTGLFILLIGVRHIVDRQTIDMSKKYDAKGALLCIFSLSSLAYGLSALSNGMFPAIFAVVGAVLLLLFIKHELYAENSFLDLSLFKNKHFATGNVAALISYSATFAVGFLLSVYLQEVQGLDPEKSGTILLAQPVMMAIVAPMAGKLSDHYRPRLLASIGMGITASVLAVFVFLDNNTSGVLIFLLLAILGVGFAFFSSPNANVVMGSVDMAHYSASASLLATMRMLGNMASMAIVMLIFGIFSVSGDILIAVKISFAVFALLCLGAIRL